MSLVSPEQVGALLRNVAAAIVLPRYRSLGSGEVVEKSAGELVTVADREAELAIGQGLHELLPAARLIGEEACAERPDLIEHLADELVWLVDPIDGTANFAAGRPPFAMMIALLEHGVVRQSWILDPLHDVLFHADRGGGAFRDGVKVTGGTDRSVERDLCGILSEAFLPAEQRHLGETLRARFGRVLPTQRCAGHEYPLVALGERDFAIYWRTLPWDHAAGALLLSEAGGRALHFDGSPYGPAVQRSGLLLARNPEVADLLLRAVTADDEMGLGGSRAG
ncbi:inositol monophosphatase [Sphingomonas sp. BN140010]|uniref:Inositol monophosphatase n=1 Tax=Sphingomonas arvum TaxID=2992113 RepID=A0ABT3JC64_9SPHN|nr:inositol monophosphatase family protein [Sphingomonas sp. BN140010]MCW3796663.1 inositol monophosphatase [Sphingomonas sp. BN140010]